MVVSSLLRNLVKKWRAARSSRNSNPKKKTRTSSKRGRNEATQPMSFLVPSNSIVRSSVKTDIIFQAFTHPTTWNRKEYSHWKITLFRILYWISWSKRSNKKLGAVSFTYLSEGSCQARYLHLNIARFSKRPILRWPTSSGLHPTHSQLLPHPRCRRDVFFLEQRFGFAYRPDHDVVQNCYVVVSQEESSQYFASPCPLAIEGVWIEISLQQFLWQCMPRVWFSKGSH